MLPSPTRRSLLTETANSEQLLMVAAVTVARCFIVSGRSYGLILATVCGLDYWFACYHIQRYVALSVIGHRMCNRISGLCDKSSITIDTKRYRETSLVCCLRYYYSCCQTPPTSRDGRMTASRNRPRSAKKAKTSS